MPLKKVLPLLFIGALLLTSTTGCTDNTATPTPTVKATAAATAAPANVTKVLTATYEGKNYTIVKAFSRQTNDTYAGVVRSGGGIASTNVTFIKRSSEGDARSHLAAVISDYKSRSYMVELQYENDVSLGKAVGTSCRELVQIVVENLGGTVGWGVRTESTVYCD